jgi:hypothetical protein
MSGNQWATPANCPTVKKLYRRASSLGTCGENEKVFANGKNGARSAGFSGQE